MNGWTVDINGSEFVPAELNEDIQQEDLDWLNDNLLPVVVPIMDVGPEFVRNAILGIPNECPVIFVSATPDKEVNAQEKSVAQQYQGEQDRNVLWLRQTGADLRGFLEDEYPSLIEDGEIVTGYREALLIGSFVCKALGSEYMAVVDGDNWNPMALREYVTLYARGLRNGADYVSIEWRCKPKCGDEGFEWRGEGRTSKMANEYLSRLITDNTDVVAPEVITSSCAGDHAVTLDLWDEIEHTPNHSGEVNSFVKIMEGNPEATLMQYRAMSPQFHQYGSEEHIEQEKLEVMWPIYHSELASPEMKDEIFEAIGEEVEDHPGHYEKTGSVGDSLLQRLEA